MLTIRSARQSPCRNLRFVARASDVILFPVDGVPTLASSMVYIVNQEKGVGVEKRDDAQESQVAYGSIGPTSIYSNRRWTGPSPSVLPNDIADQHNAEWSTWSVSSVLIGAFNAMRSHSLDRMRCMQSRKESSIVNLSLRCDSWLAQRDFRNHKIWVWFAR